MFESIFAFVAGDQKLQAAIYSLVTSLIITGLARLFSAKARIRWGRVHQNHFMIKNKEGNLSSVVTANYSITNAGRATATNIEISFNWKPEHYEVFPHIDFTNLIREDGRMILKIPRINKGQLINIAVINAGNEHPDLTYISFDGGEAKELPFTPQRVYPLKVTLASVAFMIIGLITVLYWSFRLILSGFS